MAGKTITEAEFIQKVKEVHGDAYDLSLAKFVNNTTPVLVRCVRHGTVGEIAPYAFIRGKGACYDCRNEKIGKTRQQKNMSEILQKLKECLEPHGISFSIKKYEGTARTIVHMKCKKHGAFKSTLTNILYSNVRCPKCKKEENDRKRIQGNLEKFKKQIPAHVLDRIKPDYSSFRGLSKPMQFTCKIHKHTFTTLPNRFLKNKLHCPKCKADKTRQVMSLPFDDIKYRVRCLYGTDYVLDETTYKGSKVPMRVICPKHGGFYIRPNDILSGHACPTCARSGGASKDELELRRFIESLGLKTKKGNKMQLEKAGIQDTGRLEYDILIPEKKVAVEFNGTHWHSEKFVDRRYHLEKTQIMEKNGWQLIHIWSDDWQYMKEKVKKRLEIWLKKSYDVGARETSVQEITWTTAKTFLDTWHMQGAGVPARYCYGLYDNNGNLLAVMTFSTTRFGNNADYELTRYASSKKIPGAFQKLLRSFKKKGTVISYSDRCWGVGRIYEAAGFKKTRVSDVGYWWYKPTQHRKYDRHYFQKHKLSDVLKTFDPSKSETENCRNNGFIKIYSCGTIRWELAI